MSQRYRVEFELVGNAGNIEAVLNRLNNGIRQTGDSTRRTTNEMGLWQRQMMAMGTTARYALAGGVVFGVTAAVGALSQFERKMGQIMAIMGNLGTSGGFSQAQRDIRSIGDYALTASIRLNTSVESLQDAVQIFYSSFDVPAGEKGLRQVKEFTDTMTKLGAVAEAKNFEQLATGVIGFSQALGRGRPDIQKYANEISRFVAISLGIRGDVLAQGIGNIGATARIGGFTAEQSLAYLATAAQGGGSPAVTMRGVAQMQRVLLNPTTPRQKEAYAAVGLSSDPTVLARMGGHKVLQQMLKGVRRRGGIAGVGGISEETLASAGSAGEAGVSGGGSGVAFNLFGRAEALRAFTTIYSQQGTRKDFDYFLQQITEAGTNMEALNQQFEAFMSQSTLSNVSNAFHAASIQAVRSLDPLLHPAAKGVTWGLGQATAHPRATIAVEGALFAALGARALSRFIPGGAGRVLGRFGKVAGLGGAAVGTALTGEAAANLLGGGRTDGTRANPYWVILHPASQFVGSPGGYGPLGGPGGTTTVPGKMPGWATKVAPIAVGTAIAAPFAWAGYEHFKANVGTPGPRPLNALMNRRAGESVEDLIERAIPSSSWSRRKDWEGAIGKRGFAPTKIEVVGDAKVDIQMKLTDAQGRVLRVEQKSGVPVKLWDARTVPQHRGKPKDTRKGR